LAQILKQIKVMPLSQVAMIAQAAAERFVICSVFDEAAS